MSSPLVTISLPIYNAERFLAESIESIKAQTFTDFEVIAVLDGCTDRSEEILMDLKDERFVVVTEERNHGITFGLNAAVEKARGVFVARMDADDVMVPTRLEKQVAFMMAHADISLLGTWFDLIDERGKFKRAAFPFSSEHEAIKEGFRVRNNMGSPTMMFRTEEMRAMGGYIPGYPLSEDLVISLRYLAAGKRFAILPEVLLHYRVHERQDMVTKKRPSFEYANKAYREFGPLIWGKDAPDIEFGAPLHRRVLRKLKRLWR